MAIVWCRNYEYLNEVSQIEFKRNFRWYILYYGVGTQSSLMENWGSLAINNWNWALLEDFGLRNKMAAIETFELFFHKSGKTPFNSDSYLLQLQSDNAHLLFK